MTDYLPPAGFKHKPSPALDYAHLPQREEDLEMLEKAKAEADEKRNLETPDSNDGINDQRTSIGPFGECVPPSNMDDSDIHRVQFYADNHALKIPMVSPLFDKRHLRQLPRLLVVGYCAEYIIHRSLMVFFILSNVVQQKDYVTNPFLLPWKRPTAILGQPIKTQRKEILPMSF